MKSNSMGWYVENNDFEGAVERWLNTSANWKKKWFQTCEMIFNNSKEWSKKYILNPIDYSIKKIYGILTQRKTKYSETIQVAEGVDLLDNAKEKCYLFSFFDAKNNLVCSKIGTTTRTVRERLKEELNSSTYKNTGCVKAVINRVYDCGDTPAEGLESYFRAIYIKKYPNSFKKNDRFMNEWFNLEEADKIVSKYLKK